MVGRRTKIDKLLDVGQRNGQRVGRRTDTCTSDWTINKWKSGWTMEKQDKQLDDGSMVR